MPIKDINSLSKNDLIQQYIIMRQMLDQKTKQYNSLQKDYDDLKANYNDLTEKYNAAQEKYMTLIAAKFQTQRSHYIIDMPTLFNDAEDEALKVEKEESETITIREHKRKKRVPKEKHIDYSTLRHDYVTEPIPEGADICPKCGSKMVLKKYIEEKELVVIPADTFIRVHKIPYMECVECQSINEDGKSTYVEVPHKKKPFERSLCSAELLAYIIDQKYSAGLPLDTIERQFDKQGVKIPKQNMCNWILKSSKYVNPLYELMKQELMKYPVVHADETHTQVLREENKPAESTSYMWVYHTAPEYTPIILYDYEDSRSGDRPAEFLKGFQGDFLTTDAYSGYNKVEGVQRAECNMHALKNFKDAYKLLDKGKGRGDSDEAKAIRMYQDIFHRNNKIEKQAKEKYSDRDKRFEYIEKRRQKEVKPKFDEFLTWLETIEPSCGRYKMKQAINYVLNNRKELTLFLYHGCLSMTNLICERAIRPFVVIRNRCKFYVSTHGADTSAKIYSLMITATENGLNPYMYFMHIFKELPNLDLDNPDVLKSYLPYSDELPSWTKKMNNSEARKILKELS